MKKGWQTKKLGDVCDFEGGSQPPKSQFIYEEQPGYVRFIQIRDFGSDRNITYIPQSKKNRLCNESDILIGRYGASVGKILTDKSGAYNVALMKTIPNLEILNHSWFYNYLVSAEFQRPLLNVADRSAQAGFSKDDIYNFPVPIPPLAEQQRIIRVLDEAFDCVATAKANAEKNLENVRALFEDALDLALQGKLIPQSLSDAPVSELLDRIGTARRVAIDEGKARREKTDPIDATQLQFDLPKEWRWVQLESLTVGISDGVHKTPQYVTEGIPFVTVKNLTAGPGISFDNLNYITRKDHDEFVKRTHPEKGDILITKDGTIGVVRLIDTDIEFSIFVSVALIKPVIRELSRYLVYALRASCVQRQIVPQGAALKHLYLVDLRRLAIPFPPLAEQNRIVARLDDLSEETQRLESIYRRKVDAVDALKRSLLHEAFSGNL